jgi:DNA polymerase III subunit epsilon
VVMAPVFGFHCRQHELCIQCERRQMTGLVLTLEELSPRNGVPIPGRRFPSPPVTGVGCEEALIPLPRPVYYEFDLFTQDGFGEWGRLPLRKLTYVVFDTETTGLDPAGGDEIVQLGAVRIVNGRILQGEVVDQLVDPRRTIPDEAVAVHGITGKMVAGQPTVEELLPHFHRFTEGAVLVAHNAAFDMRCLQLKEVQSGVRFDNPVLDTLILSSVVHPHQEGHSLEGIASRLNLTVVGRHTALGDALVTAEILLKLIPLLEAQGITTLEEALKASRASPYARVTY